MYYAAVLRLKSRTAVRRNQTASVSAKLDVAQPCRCYYADYLGPRSNVLQYTTTATTTTIRAENTLIELLRGQIHHNRLA